MAARAEPRAPVSTFHVEGQEEVGRAAGLLSTFATRYAAELRLASDALRQQGDCKIPAWQLGRRVPPRAEAALHGLQLQLNALTAVLEDGVRPGGPRSYAAVLQRPLSSPERAHVSDLEFFVTELQRFLSRAQCLIAELRCHPGGALAYLNASAGILDLIAVLCSTVQQCNRLRIEEFAPRVANAEVWPTPYFEHAHAMGAAQLMTTLGSAT